MKTFGLILLLVLAGWLGQVMGQACRLYVAPPTGASCDHLARHAPYVVGARRLDDNFVRALRTNHPLILFEVVKSFRRETFCDTLIFDGMDYANVPRDGIFFIERLMEPEIEIREQIKAKVVQFNFINYAYEFPLFEPSIRSSCGTFKDRKALFDWLYQLPDIVRHPLDSWSQVLPAEKFTETYIGQMRDEMNNYINRIAGDTSNTYAKNVSYDQYKTYKAEYYRVYDSIMKIKYPKDTLFSWRQDHIPQSIKVILWPERYPPPQPDNRGSAAEY